MERHLYLECYTGISGDMMVGALLDLGADENVLKESLNSLPLEGFEIQIERVLKSGLDVCNFTVKMDEFHENHDHDMAFLYPKTESIHGHSHKHQHEHHGQHHNDHGQHHHHEHRTLSQVKDIISKGRMTDSARELAFRIFEILGEAEAKAHGKSLEQVHFHEVGAVDSIVDIVAVAVCMDNLGIKKVTIPFLAEGSGMIRCQHGMMPVPVPAVSNILSKYGIAIQPQNRKAELITPTGAAICAAIRTDDQLPEGFLMKKIGMGAGKREYKIPSVVRAIIIEESSKKNRIEDRVFQLETNLDDCSGENMGFVMERLFAEGAKDVSFIPIFMKKNRPAYQLNVVCDKGEADKMEQIIFRHTTALGIRRYEVQRTILERSEINFMTKYGYIKAKCCVHKDRKICYPEYESVSKICKENDLNYQETYAWIFAKINENSNTQI